MNVTQKPINQRRWKEPELQKAAKLFMSGMDYDEIALHVPSFSAQSVESKLTKQGFTKEYRKNKLVRAVNQ